MWLVEVAIRDVSFENIIVTGAVHAGLIRGVQNDLLKGLSFKNVTFLHPPTHGWSCKYVAGDFVAKHVSPPLEC